MTMVNYGDYGENYDHSNLIELDWKHQSNPTMGTMVICNNNLDPGHDPVENPLPSQPEVYCLQDTL